MFYWEDLLDFLQASVPPYQAGQDAWDYMCSLESALYASGAPSQDWLELAQYLAGPEIEPWLCGREICSFAEFQDQFLQCYSSNFDSAAAHSAPYQAGWGSPQAAYHYTCTPWEAGEPAHDDWQDGCRPLSLADMQQEIDDLRAQIAELQAAWARPPATAELADYAEMRADVYPSTAYLQRRPRAAECPMEDAIETWPDLPGPSPYADDGYHGAGSYIDPTPIWPPDADDYGSAGDYSDAGGYSDADSYHTAGYASDIEQENETWAARYESHNSLQAPSHLPAAALAPHVASMAAVPALSVSFLAAAAPSPFAGLEDQAPLPGGRGIAGTVDISADYAQGPISAGIAGTVNIATDYARGPISAELAADLTHAQEGADLLELPTAPKVTAFDPGPLAGTNYSYPDLLVDESATDAAMLQPRLEDMLAQGYFRPWSLGCAGTFVLIPFGGLAPMDRSRLLLQHLDSTFDALIVPEEQDAPDMPLSDEMQDRHGVAKEQLALFRMDEIT